MVVVLAVLLPLSGAREASNITTWYLLPEREARDFLEVGCLAKGPELFEVYPVHEDVYVRPYRAGTPVTENERRFSAARDIDSSWLRSVFGSETLMDLEVGHLSALDRGPEKQLVWWPSRKAGYRTLFKGIHIHSVARVNHSVAWAFGERHDLKAERQAIALRVSTGEKRANVDKVVPLPATPSLSHAFSNSIYLIDETASVFAFDSEGKTQLGKRNVGQFYATSIARGGADSFFVGANTAVLEIVELGGEVAYRWRMPSKSYYARWKARCIEAYGGKLPADVETISQ